MPNVSVRLSEKEAKTLDELVIAIESYYTNRSEDIPPLRDVKTNRSTALRDLLNSWRHGMNAPETFPPVERGKR